MRVAELLSELRRLDAHVVLDGDRLRLNAPTGVLTERHRQELRSRKQEIVDFLRAAQQLASQQRALIPLSAEGSGIPIFAVAGHNGDVFCYRAIAGQLGSDQPFYGLQPPGYDEGTEPMRSVGSLAEYFARQIRAFRPNGPMTIAGFCAGGTVAFELARQLEADGADVRNLVHFGAPYATSYRRLSQLIATSAYLAQRSVVHARALVTSSDRAHYLADRLRVFRTGSGAEPEAAPEAAPEAPSEAAPEDPVLARRAAVEVATMAAVRDYTPQSFDGHLDLMIPCAAWKSSFDAPLRWRNLVRTSAEFVGPDDCNGDIMLLPEHAPTFAAFLKEAQRHALART
jgi:thioesterase domain-containing protein